jgi:hypothetical protein
LGISGDDAGTRGTDGGGASGDDAVWRDLVARYDMVIDPEITALPWPDQEDLRTRPRSPAPQDQPLTGQPPGQALLDPGVGPVPPDQAAGDQEQVRRDRAAQRTGSDPGPSVHPADNPADGPASTPGRDQARVIRPASAPAPRSPSAGEEFEEYEDEHFIPPPPPPLPQLDSVAKGAWAALAGGPAYLLIASLAGWVVPGWAALASVAAFVGGFTVIVIRLGDGPSRGAGPDNGAVL